MGCQRHANGMELQDSFEEKAARCDRAVAELAEYRCRLDNEFREIMKAAARGKQIMDKSKLIELVDALYAEVKQLKAEAEQLRFALSDVGVLVGLGRQWPDDLDAFASAVDDVAHARHVAQRERDEARAEIKRLNEAKTIILGECKVIVASAHEVGKDVENEVLLVDAAGRKACIGENCSELSGTVMENANPHLLARLVVAHPDGASILIEQLEEALIAQLKEAERLWEKG